MGIGQAVIGAGATVLAKMLSLKVWRLHNHTSNETIDGQFAAEEVTRTAGANWTTIQALNRQTGFLQFLNGKNQTLSVKSRFFKRDLLDPSPVERFEKLAEWCAMDAKARRPPLLTFSLGDGMGLQMDVLLDNISGIRYGRPNALGGIREVEFTMEFTRWSDTVFYNPEAKEVTDTRYARAKARDYHELLAAREYGDPMVGVVLRRNDPTQPVVPIGQIVKLPSSEGIRYERAQPTSLQLRTAFGTRDTPQKLLAETWFKKRSQPSAARRALAVKPLQPEILSMPQGIFNPSNYGDCVLYLDPAELSSLTLHTASITNGDTFFGWTATDVSGNANDDGNGGTRFTVDGAAASPMVQQTVTNSSVNATANAPCVYTVQIRTFDVGWIVVQSRANVAANQTWFRIDGGAIVGTSGANHSGATISAPDVEGYRTVSLTMNANSGTHVFNVRLVSDNGITTAPPAGAYVWLKNGTISQTRASITSMISGASWAAPAVNNQPGYVAQGINGKPSLRSYNAAALSQFLESSDPTALSAFSGDDVPWTFFAVQQSLHTISTQANSLFSAFSGVADNLTAILQSNAGIGPWAIYRKDSLGVQTVNESTTHGGTGVPHVVEAWFDGAQTFLTLDGAAPSPNGGASVRATISPTAMRLLAHGTSAGSNQLLGSVIIFKGALGAVERSAVRQAMAAKYTIPVAA